MRESGFLGALVLLLVLHHSVYGHSSNSSQNRVSVEGQIRRVIEASGETIIQLLVSQSKVMRPSVGGSAFSYPAPGELVYIHLERNRRQPSAKKLQASKRIRVILQRDSNGQWVAEDPKAFEEMGDTRITSNGQNNRARNSKPFGLLTELAFVGGKPALKVKGVVANSPAAKAGIEDGDILMRIDGRPLDSLASLSRAEAGGKATVVVTVKDIRTGREVDVPISNDSAAATSNRMKPLGVTSELAFYKGEAAVKVTKVKPNSPAEKSGLKAGNLILKANGKKVGSPAELDELAQKSSGTLLLEVFNPDSRDTKMLRALLR